MDDVTGTCTGAKSAASLKPRLARLINSFTRRGARPSAPADLMASDCSFTTAPTALQSMRNSRHTAAWPAIG